MLVLSRSIRMFSSQSVERFILRETKKQLFPSETINMLKNINDEKSSFFFNLKESAKYFLISGGSYSLISGMNYFFESVDESNMELLLPLAYPILMVSTFLIVVGSFSFLISLYYLTIKQGGCAINKMRKESKIIDTLDSNTDFYKLNEVIPVVRKYIGEKNYNCVKICYDSEMYYQNK